MAAISLNPVRKQEKSVMSTNSDAPPFWWEREDLGYRNNRLFLGSRQLLEFAHTTRTPVYLYNAARVKENLTRLTRALQKEKIKFQIGRNFWTLSMVFGPM